LSHAALKSFIACTSAGSLTFWAQAENSKSNNAKAKVLAFMETSLVVQSRNGKKATNCYAKSKSVRSVKRNKALKAGKLPKTGASGFQ
jgi:hypothetical protein